MPPTPLQRSATRPHSVWGVDVAVDHLDFGFADLDGDAVHVETLSMRTDAREGERLGFIDREVRAAVRGLNDEHPAAVAWVEQPSGRYPHPQLAYVCGVAQGAIFATLQVPVWTLTSGAWKKRTIGVGNASKPQVRAWVERRLGRQLESQDQCDAACLALAGKAMLVAGSIDAAVAA